MVAGINRSLSTKFQPILIHFHFLYPFLLCEAWVLHRPCLKICLQKPTLHRLTIEMTRLFKSAESIVHGTPFVPGNLSIISLLIFYLLINGLFCYIEKRVWSNFYSTKIAIFRAPALFLEKAVGCEQEKQPFGGGFLLRVAIFFGQNFDDFLKCSIFLLFEMYDLFRQNNRIIIRENFLNIVDNFSYFIPLIICLF